MPYNNAVMESFFGSLRRKLIHHKRFADRDAARIQACDYIEGFYNHHRLHSSLGYRSPGAFVRVVLASN